MIYLVGALEIVAVLLNNWNGHYNPPGGITYTPFLIVFVVLANFILFRKNYVSPISWQLFIVILNDLLLKSFAGGTHDLEGAEWITFSTTIGVAVSAIIALIYVPLNNTQQTLGKLVALASYVAIYLMYAKASYTVGVNAYY